MKIIHRCDECGYPEEYHPFVRAFAPECRVDKAVIKQQPSELIPTFDTAGRLVEDITEPGSIWPGGHPKITTCDCEGCWGEYYFLTGSQHFEEIDHEDVRSPA